ncbi:glutamyl aminopeptidase-like [Sinocyclocheilus grahami]|uniref:glutamyl aminopeptidase-like n=1 Tax=Sinocyclocheilus grahami TaxID=75366 RepID=UPI0007AD5D21|nr:PREDICTED: glutamyl aminopeptidase-like [Sinocyclocheilus grahami]
MESLEFEKKEKRYFIRGKHAAIICAVIIVTGVAVGLGVGLSQKTSSSEEEPKPTPLPTTPLPTMPPDDQGPCKPSDNTNGGWNNFRLPDYMVPFHYDLHLEPDLDTDIYTGSVSIHLTLTQPSQHLWLHIRETFVTAVPSLQRSGPSGLTSVRVKECFEYKPQEYVVVEAAEQLSVTGPDEHYILTLHFQGWLNGSLVGFYRTTYQENEVTKKIAATDHEPTDARKSFPCFDEPNKKATYTISITHGSAYEALSNMPVENIEKVSDQKTKTSFKKSVKMSTYLVCFAVHQFHYVERTSKRNIPLRIYAQPLQISTAEYAANVTKIIFDYFEEYFDMEYSIEKLDKIAIPDFGTGAMENWGLITYRETNLLFDENESSSINKQRVASVIAHELVHQWFGNIVTMDWWDDLWLNEGFASFFEYVGVEEAEPDWGMRDIMLINDVFPVMVDDALLSSHPIIVDVSSPAEITSVFDAISYNKGASILRMLEDLLGRDTFRDGCRGYKWTIPVKWSTLDSKNASFQFDKGDTEVVIAGYSPATDGLIKVNKDHMGFYRVNHRDHVWSAIAEQLSVNHQVYDATDRSSYIDDVFAFGRADIVDYGHAFNLTRYLANETEYIVWDRVSTSISYVSDMLADDTALYPKFQKLFSDHVQKISKELGWNDEGTQTQRLLRETVLGIACQMGDQEALDQAYDIFSKWIDGTVSSVAVNLRLLVYRYGMKKSASVQSWEIMFRKYVSATLAQEKDKLLYGLASVEDITLLHRLLEAAKNESIVRSQDVFTLVQYVSRNPLGKTMAWDWVTLNWDYLVNRYTINDRNLGRLPSIITSTYNTDMQLWKMEHFFALHPNAGAGEMPRKQAIETVKNNIEWMKQNLDEIRVWLDNNVVLEN